jgi:hypothetical protein
MGLFKFFTGKSPADYERKGDAFAQRENWGEAKLAFEAALENLSPNYRPIGKCATACRKSCTTAKRHSP